MKGKIHHLITGMVNGGKANGRDWKSFILPIVFGIGIGVLATMLLRLANGGFRF